MCYENKYYLSIWNFFYYWFLGNIDIFVWLFIERLNDENIVVKIIDMFKMDEYL